MSNLSKSLDVLMHEHQLTASKLADDIGLSPLVILRISTGQLSNPRLSTLEKIAAAFGLNINQMLNASLLKE